LERDNLERLEKLDVWKGSEVVSETAVVGEEVGNGSVDLVLIRWRDECEVLKDDCLLCRFILERENEEERLESMPKVRDFGMMGAC
jgi:hypothetical protein